MAFARNYWYTPSTETTTYDFWLVARDFALDDLEVDEFLATMNDEVVDQDVRALAVLEQRIAAEPGGIEVDIKIDRGGLAARRAWPRSSPTKPVSPPWPRHD